MVYLSDGNRGPGIRGVSSGPIARSDVSPKSQVRFVGRYSTRRFLHSQKEIHHAQRRSPRSEWRRTEDRPGNGILSRRWPSGTCHGKPGGRAERDRREPRQPRRRRGGGGGRHGRRRRHLFHATGLTGWQQQADRMTAELDEIRQQIQELQHRQESNGEQAVDGTRLLTHGGGITG
jgi:hypothetical protein